MLLTCRKTRKSDVLYHRGHSLTGVPTMTQQDLQDLIRMACAGRRDAADKLAELLHPLLKGETEAKVTKRKVPTE